MKKKMLLWIWGQGMFTMIFTSAMLFMGFRTGSLNESGYVFFGSLFICGLLVFVYVSIKLEFSLNLSYKEKIE